MTWLLRFWWSVPVIALVAALLVTRGTLADTKATLADTRAAYEAFQSDVKTKTAQAKADDAAHALDVQNQHDDLNQEVANAYQSKLDDMGKRYAALRMQLTEAQTHSGVGGAANVSGPVAGTGHALTAAQSDRLLNLLREADENTLKLIALQRAASEQAKVR